MTELRTKLFEINAINSAISIMDWDQQTLMPKGGAEARAEHVSILSRISHELSTSEELGNLIESSKANASPEDTAMLRVTKRQFDINTKLPTSLVEKKSKLSAQGHELWVEARKENSFKTFAPVLEQMFDICREEAELFGYKDHIYDALLDTYEEGATHADCERMFQAIKAPSTALIKQIGALKPVDDSGLYGSWPEADQKAFTEMLLGKIGFDLNRGRQDTAPHPFCTGWSVNDIRLTTRFKDYLPSSIFGSLHEAGHGMYEQGSPQKWDRTPLAGGVSLGVHESQSRTWENIVGRSEAFWSYFLPHLHKAFPATQHYDLKTFIKAINKVKPSFIRVEADELTYNLHVIVRFEIESDVLSGKLKVKDMPAAWNAKYEEYLGITPPTDSVGCLQDVHWSMGSIGYFPTYSMGNLLSYQIFGKLREDVKDVEGLMANGDFAPILHWLQEKIYSQGRLYTPRDLVLRVTGKPMGAEDYLAGLSAKYRALYEI